MSSDRLREAGQKAISAWEAWSRTSERLPSPEWIDAMGEIRAALAATPMRKAVVRDVSERTKEGICNHPFVAAGSEKLGIPPAIIDRCELPYGHVGQHKNGNASWGAPAVQPEAQVMERVRKLPGVTDDGTWVQCPTSEVAALVTRECDAALEQQVRTDCGRLNCWTDGTGAGVEEVLHNPSLDENVKQLARAHRHATDAARLACARWAAYIGHDDEEFLCDLMRGDISAANRDADVDAAIERALAAGKEQPHD